MEVFRFGHYCSRSDVIVFSGGPSENAGSDCIRLSFDPMGGGLGMAFDGATPIGWVAVGDFLFAEQAVPWNRPCRAPLDRSVVLLVDLVQDFSVFLPILVRLQGLGVPVHVIASRGFLARPKADEHMAVYRQLARSLTIADSPRTVREALPADTRMVLCASESSVPAHRFCHGALTAVPAGVTTVTFQHGFENVGLMQAPSHTDAYGDTVVFRSDLVGVWGAPDSYPNAAASQRDKLVPIGIIRPLSPGRPPQVAARADHSGRKRVMVAENLHSLRFSSPLRDEFIRFIEEDVARAFDVVIRPHPGGTYSTRNDLFEQFPKVEGPLTWQSFQNIDFVICPPSSFVFDAIMASLPVYVWSPSERDSYNYRDLLSGSFREFCADMEENLYRRVTDQWRFLYTHTSSISGTENFLRHLF